MEGIERLLEWTSQLAPEEEEIAGLAVGGSSIQAGAENVQTFSLTLCWCWHLVSLLQTFLKLFSPSFLTHYRVFSSPNSLAWPKAEQ